MKSIYIFIILMMSIALLFCGCSRGDKAGIGGYIEEYIYEQTGDAQRMAAFGDILYTVGADENYASVFSSYDMNGKQITKAVFSDFQPYDITSICAGESGVYAAIYSGGKHRLCLIDVRANTATELAALDNLDSIEKISVCGGRIYWLGEKRSEAKPVGPFTTEEGVSVYFEDKGKKMGSVDLESGGNVPSDIEFPVAFSVLGDSVTVYAYDSEGGYYFADYEESSAKRYTNKLGILTNFEFYGGGGEFAFIGANDFSGVLPVSKADGESGVIRAAKNVYPYFASDLCASDAGYVWLITADSAISAEKRIKRYDMSSVTVSGNPIRLISSQYYAEQPFAAESEIQMNQLSGEGFALTVLSLDKSYDAAMISSNQGVANDVKEKGCFYPLNDVPGVSEYLDKCFPYIKDAVTDSEGDIRLLPVAVEIPLIAYNESNCSENGIALSPELEPFIQSVKQAADVSEYYDCPRYWMMQTQLNGYLSGNRSFDTEEFRRIAVLLKEQCDENIFKGNFELYSALMTVQTGMEDPYYTQIYDETLFTQLPSRFQQTTLLNDKNLRAAPLPLSGNGKSVAVCTFLCVNPYSDRLSETLGYIENIVNTMFSERNSCMLADQSTYDSTAFARDMYSIYQNGEICFQIPREIYSGDFDRYCADEITLDQFIAEADRKLSAYLNE